MKIKITLFLFVFALTLSKAQLRINEVCPSNYSVYYDEESGTPDWIEIYNDGNNAVDLKDWRLSDGDVFEDAWIFPNKIIQPGEYLLVHASGKDKIQPNIKISSNGINTYSNTDHDNLSMLYLPLSGNNKVTARLNSFYYDLNPENYEGFAGLIFKDELNARSRMIGNFAKQEYLKTFMSFYRDSLGLFRKVDLFDGSYSYEDYYVSIEVKGDSVFNSILDRDKNVLERQKFHISGINKYNIGLTVVSRDENKYHELNVSELYLNDNPVNPKDLQKAEFFDTEIKVSYDEFLHTDFELNKDEESVVLYKPDGSTADLVTFENMFRDISITRKNGNYYYSDYPTPGKENSDVHEARSEKPKLEDDLFFFDDKLKLHFENEEDLYFTEDHSAPTENSMKFSQSTTFDTTALIKFRRIEENKVHSDILNLPLIKNEDVVSGEYNFYVFAEDEYYFREKDGILQHAFSEIRFDGRLVVLKGKDVIYNGEVEIMQSGKTSNSFFPQNSLKVKFDDYDDAEFIQDEIFDYKQDHYGDVIVLRNAGNDWKAGFIRDALAHNVSKEIETLEWTEFRTVPVYINGMFWGAYNAREKINERYFARKFDADKDSVNMFINSLIVNEGTNYELLEFEKGFEELSKNYDKFYKTADSLIDLKNLIDYCFYLTFTGNRDWPQNNIEVYNIPGKRKWQMFLNDMDFSFGLDGVAENHNNLTKIFDFDETFIMRVFQELIKGKDFRNRFLNRSCDLMNQPLKAGEMSARFDKLIERMEPLMIMQEKRWNKTFSKWETEIQGIKNYLMERHPFYREFLSEHFDLTGSAEIKLSSYPENSGNFLVNTIETDSSVWTGKYFQNIPVSITAVPKQGYEFAGWSDASLPDSRSVEVMLPESYELQAVYEPKDPRLKDTFIVINEVMYKSPDDMDSEDWTELINAGQKDVDLSGWYILDDDDTHDKFVFPEGTVLQRGEYLVISRDKDDFKDIYGLNEDETLLGDFDFGFGEVDKVRLYDAEGKIHDEVDYDNEKPWHPDAYGLGYTMELKNPALDNNVGENWDISKPKGGTPFGRNSVHDSIPSNIINHQQADISYWISKNKLLKLSADELFYGLSIHDITGRKYYALEFDIGKDRADVDLSTLKRGVYIAVIRFAEDYSAIKLLLEK